MKTSGALAVFVKTPGLSPVKTRLASAIGVRLAEEFYELSIHATKSVVIELTKQFPGLQVYWAVAEKNGMESSFWTDFSRVWQGTGDLGERLHSVYSQILSRHHFVCFIGADSPHVDVSTVSKGIFLTAKHLERKFVIGPAMDGGFYFFGGSANLPKETWCQVDYSTDKTSRQLENQLTAFGGLEKIEMEFDVDTAEDLIKLYKKLDSSENLLPEQKTLLAWLRSMGFARSAGRCFSDV